MMRDVIASRTGVVSAAAPIRAMAFTTSRSETMPSTLRSCITTMAPIRRSLSVVATWPSVASGPTVTTSEPFSFKIVATFMASPPVIAGRKAGCAGNRPDGNDATFRRIGQGQRQKPTVSAT